MPPKDMREYLPAESIAQIHQPTVRILESVGVDFPSKAALDVFKRHAVKTDGSRVYLSEAQLFKALGTAPHQFTL